MKRLTAWEEGKAYYPECFEEPCLGMGCEEEICEFNAKVCETLARYEDTSLTPEQLIEIDRLYLEKCEEVNRLREKQMPEKPHKIITPPSGAVAVKCPACDETVAGAFHYCPYCGTRMPWGDEDE